MGFPRARFSVAVKITEFIYLPKYDELLTGLTMIVSLNDKYIQECFSMIIHIRGLPNLSHALCIVVVLRVVN